MLRMFGAFEQGGRIMDEIVGVFQQRPRLFSEGPGRTMELARHDFPLAALTADGDQTTGRSVTPATMREVEAVRPGWLTRCAVVLGANVA